jgi:ankyrin repeat protein
MLASLYGHESIVKALLAAGAEIEGNWNINIAIVFCLNISFLVCLLDKNDDGYTALILAIHNSRESIVKALLAAGANIEGNYN